MNLEIKYFKSPEEISGDFFLDLHQLDLLDFPNPWTKVAFVDFINGHEFLLVAVYVDNTLRGFSLFDLQVVDSFAHLLKIVISSAFRKKNLGSLLLSESLKQLELLKIKKYFLEVEETNQSAIALYEKQGFKQIHRNKNFYGNNRHALIMTRENG